MSMIFNWDARLGSLRDQVSNTAGTLTAGTGGFRKTEKGLAMEFDGSATKIATGAFSEVGNIVSINIWIKTSNDNTAVDDGIFGQWDTNTMRKFILAQQLTTNKLVFLTSPDGSYDAGNVIESTVAINDGKWHHIIAIHDGSYNYLYIDNVLNVSADVANGLFTTTTPLSFGNIQATGSPIGNSYYGGYIGKTELYNTALTQSERNNLYEEFLQSYGTEKPTTNFTYQKPTDLSREVDSVVGEFNTLNITASIGTPTIDGNTVTLAPTEAVRDLNYWKVGSKYLVDVTVTNYSGAGTGLILPYGNTVTPVKATANGNYVYEITPDITNMQMYAYANSSGTITINSIRELTGLVAAYSFSPETVKGGEIVDISGEGNTGAISGATLTKDGMKFDGVDDYISVANDASLNFGSSQDFSFCVRIKPNSVTGTQRILNKGSVGVGGKRYLLVLVDDDVVFGMDDDSDSIGLYSTSPVLINTENTIVVSADRSGNAVLYLNGCNVGVEDISGIGDIDDATKPFAIGMNSDDLISDPFNGEIQDLKIYNYAFTPAQAARYHNSFIRPTLIESFENYPVGSIANPQGTGVYTIAERATSSALFDTGDKELVCGTAGTYPIRQTNAYGEFEFNVNKDADANISEIAIISDRSNPAVSVGSNGSFSGYYTQLRSDESIRLGKNTFGGSVVSLFQTAASYIDNNTYYRLKVVRLKSEGTFPDIPTLQTSACTVGSNPYDTFTSNGRYGFRAINTAGTFQTGGTADEISVTNTEKYLIEFDLKLNSGVLPTARFNTSLGGAGLSNTYPTVEGRNSIILTATSTNTGVFNLYASAVTDFEVSGLQIRQIYDANAFCVLIKGGSYGNTETGWTLVSTTGGSGSNPVVDATYTTSEYFVADLDNLDRLSNIRITNEVKQ